MTYHASTCGPKLLESPPWTTRATVHQVLDLPLTNPESTNLHHYSIVRPPICRSPQKSAQSESSRASTLRLKFQPSDAVLSRAARASLLFWNVSPIKRRHVILWPAVPTRGLPDPLWSTEPTTANVSPRLLQLTADVSRLGKKKKKTSEEKKIPFIFHCMLFYFYFIFHIQKKKSNFEFQNSKFENSKKKRKKKEKIGIDQ